MIAAPAAADRRAPCSCWHGANTIYGVGGCCGNASVMSNLEIKNGEPGVNRDAEHSSPEFAVAGAPSYARTLFFGPDGLRPGWGLAFYVMGFLILQRVTVDLAWSRDLGDSGLWSLLLAELGSLVAAQIPAVVLARVEQRRWASYGLPGRSAFGRLFWSGGVWGFAAIRLLMLW